MQVHKRLDIRGSWFVLSVQVDLDPQEWEIVRRHDFLHFRIKTAEGPFVGRDALSINLKTAYRALLGKVKNRWSTALVRTTSFVLLDLLLLILSLLIKFIRGLLKAVFGRRKTLSALTRGVTVSSRRIEKVKEADFFIFVSLAAITKAIDYAKTAGTATTHGPDDFMKTVEGLDFAGAGTTIESDFEAVETLMSLSKTG